MQLTFGASKLRKSNVSQKRFNSIANNALSAWCFFVAALWFIFDGLILPPDFGGVDAYYFKDAGINLAEGLGFVSRFTFGNPTFEYQVYSQYPPVYPLFFGLFVKLFGVTAVTNQAFSATLDIIIGGAGFLALKPLFDSKASRFVPFLLAAIFMVSLFFGFFSPDPDRPDGLGVAFGLLGLVVLTRSHSHRNEFFAGVLCALSLFTSPFAGIWTSIALAIVLLERHFAEAGVYRSATGLLVVASGALCGLLAGGALIGLLLPGWFSAFKGVFTGATTHNETGGGYFLALLHGDLRTWLSGFAAAAASPNYLADLSKLFIVQFALLGAIIMDRLRSRDQWRGLWVLLLLVASPLCLITSPYQGSYPPITAALALAGAASVAAAMSPASRRCYAPAILIGFAFVALISTPQQVRTILIRSGTRPSMERALAYIDQTRSRFASGDQLLAVSPSNYILWRQKGVRPLTTTFTRFDDPDNRRQVPYVAVAYPGSGDPLTPQIPPWLTDTEYKLVYRPELPQVARFLRWTVSRSSQTWESAIYARQDELNR